ncbi:MAG: M48 family metallopeptidase [Planctomycetota bacterium]|jgi:predicted Zn-dependent protease
MYRKLALLIVSLLYCCCIGCSVNPLTGDEELMFFSEKHDVEIGRQYAPEIEKQLDGRIDNNDLQDYLNNVGQRIARVCHRPYLEYHFTAVNHESLNALALPGGYIFITKGMLEKLQTEAQLAGILAHEISHVVARDSMNAMSNQIGMNTLMVAALMTAHNPPRGAVAAASVTQQLLGLSYSREDERQADLGGLRYMVRARYNPYGIVETMEILENEQKVRVVEFFSTHPSPYNRITYLARRIEADYSSLTGLEVARQNYQTSVLDQLDD